MMVKLWQPRSSGFQNPIRPVDNQQPGSCGV